MASEEEKRKQELIDVLSGAENDSADLTKLGRTLLKSGQTSGEVAAGFKNLVAETPAQQLPADVVARQTEAWSAYRAAAAPVLKFAATEINSLSAVATSMVFSTSSEAATIYPPTITAPLLGSAYGEFTRIVARLPLLSDARAQLARLGLDRSHGGRPSPLAHLNEAAEARETGAGPMAVLLPIRSAIDEAVLLLMQQRPAGGPASSWAAKVASIGAQCGISGLAPTHFDLMGHQLEGLIKELSGAKKDTLSKDQVNELFNRAVAFLGALLEGIDAARLRIPPSGTLGQGP